MLAPSLVTAIDVTDSVSNASYTTNVQTVDRMSMQVNATDATPAAKQFVAADVTVDPENTITITDHGFMTGLKVALTGTNLPTGLSATDYWVIVVDEDTIKLADSLAHALAGTEVVITNAGTTADAELTPTPFDEATVEVKASLDGITYFSFSTPKTITISGTGNQYLDLGQVTYPSVRVELTASLAGALTCEVLLYAVDTQVRVHN